MYPITEKQLKALEANLGRPGKVIDKPKPKPLPKPKEKKVPGPFSIDKGEGILMCNTCCVEIPLEVIETEWACKCKEPVTVELTGVKDYFICCGKISLSYLIK